MATATSNEMRASADCALVFSSPESLHEVLDEMFAEIRKHFDRMDIVVSNADSAWTYRHLLAPEHRRRWTDRRIERARYSMSLFVWYFGVRGQYPDVAHHGILLGPRFHFDLVRPGVGLYGGLPFAAEAKSRCPPTGSPSAERQGCVRHPAGAGRRTAQREGATRIDFAFGLSGPFNVVSLSVFQSRW